VECDELKGNDGQEEGEDILSILDNDKMEYGNDDDAEGQEALLSLLRTTRRGRWADSAAKMDGCISLSLIAIAVRCGLLWFRIDRYPFECGVSEICEKSSEFCAM
jgi:hypothetical protein